MGAKTENADSLDGTAKGGLVLMFAAFMALCVANSPLEQTYFAILHAQIGSLSVQHWINDALMAVFFLLVGLEIKREMIEGQLSTWGARLLPGFGALGGMLFPALVYLIITRDSPELRSGWAIPAATDIAFALGVLALLGKRAPVSLKVFLTTLAIIDDLGAVLIIALFYAGGLSLLHLAGAAAVFVSLMALNKKGVTSLWPYIALGCVLWVLMLGSGIHATIAGVLLALTIPARRKKTETSSPLLKLEHALSKPVGFIILPVFAYANAGVSLNNVSLQSIMEPLPSGIAYALLLGKFLGVLGVTAIMVKLGKAKLPEKAGWAQMAGVSLLCGIGFTMSLFIAPLAFSATELHEQAKIGIFMGSIASGVLGYLLLWKSGSSDEKKRK